MSLIIAILIFTFVVGVCIGSFLNVVILRSLSEESIVFPASKCPKCQTPLKWWHNIPILSYIFLKGKCAFCKEPISIQYPIVELFTGIIYTLIIMKFGLSIMTLYLWIVSALLIVIAMTDIKEKVVFDVHTISLISIGLLYSLILLIATLFGLHKIDSLHFDWNLVLNNYFTLSVIGAIAGAVIMEIFARLGHLVAGTRAFGEGDTYIAAGLGAVLGFPNILIALLLSVFIQVIFTLPIFIKKLVLKKETLTLATLSAFILYAVVFGYLSVKGIVEPAGGLYITLAVILALIGLYLCKLIITGIKQESTDELTYLPFGPAMALAGLVLLVL